MFSKNSNKIDLENSTQQPKEILLIGNPNVGKSTLFNSLTRAHEHTGNFHGVTVSEAKKVVKFEGQNYCFFDLPGMYSFVPFSREEEVSKSIVLSKNCTRLLIADANSLRRNLYLSVQMMEMNLPHKILINNYDYFVKHGNQIDVKNLSKKLNIDIEIINAKKQKLTKNLINYSINNINSTEKLNYLTFFIEKIKNKYNLDKKQIILALNGVFDGLKQPEIDYIKGFYPEIIKQRYIFIDDILKNTINVKENYIYGQNKLDKLILNPFFMVISFIFLFFLFFYLIFFLIGPILTDAFIFIFNFSITNPVINLLTNITDNVWIIEFFSSGVFSSFTTILGFLPQICLMYVVLTILEDSGLIARLCYVFDDFFSRIGLNGKVVYILLCGLGCNTLATLTTRNIKGKNLKTKSAIINPYISCMARLPIYSVVASAFFGVKSFWVVLGLYLLGLIVALIMASILNKTILPTEQGELLLEFPPLKHIDIKHCLQTVFTSAVDMFRRLFSVVLSVGVIVWILTHTQFSLKYTQDITNSIAYLVADKVSFIFAPIGLNSAGIVCALFVGILAKELVVSTFSICNNVLTRSALITSLATATNVIHFSPASAVAFLIFSLLYCPCASNIAVLKAETDKFYTVFAIISQFAIAYVLAFVAYQSISRGVWVGLILMLVLTIITFAIFKTKKIKQAGCLTCDKCG